MMSRATISSADAEPPLILAIDIGSSSTRALLFDRLGRLVDGVNADQKYLIPARADGASEADADQLLTFAFDCVDGALRRAGSLASQIKGVAVSTFVSNLLGVDGAGRAIMPLTTYADTRADTEAVQLRAGVDEASAYQRTGCRFHPSYHPARPRWLARAYPADFGRVSRWLSLGEYLELKLFGETAVSYSVASWTGLLDRRRLTWDAPLLSALPITLANLSPLADVSTPRRGLRVEFAERWPALRDLPWFPAVGDGAAANVGSGCVTSAQVALTMGTTTALRTVIEGVPPPVPDGLWCYRVDGRRSLLGGALSEGGSLFAWLKSMLQLDDPIILESKLSAMPPDSHGLTVLPFLAGERSPGWAGHARATFHGMSLSTTPLEMLQAGLESVAYRIALVLDLLWGALPAEPQLIASGGALLNSPAWLQMIADVIGRPVAVSEAPEASGRGAALLALEALGAIKNLADVPALVGRSYLPNMERHPIYRAAIARQKDLYRKLIH